MQQQPAPFQTAPAVPANFGLAMAPAGADGADFDLGYEGAFPFLTEADGQDAVA